MKKIKALALLLLISLTLTGCNTNSGSVTAINDSGTGSVSSAVVSSSEISSVPASAVSGNTESKQPVESEPEPKPERTELTRSDFQDVACKLKLWARFCYDLHPDADSDYCPPLVDLSRSVTDETNTETYYKLIGTSFAAEENLFGRQESYGYVRGMLDVMFTDKFQEEFRNSPGAEGITIKDGGVYVAPVSCGDPSVIKTVKIDLKLNDDKSVLATITHEPENGETEIYHATFVSGNKGLGNFLDSVGADDGSMVGLPRLFSGNVEVVSEQFDFGTKTGSDTDYKRLPTREELEDILTLISSYTYWHLEILNHMPYSFEPGEYPISSFIDPEQSIVISKEEAQKAEEQGEYLRGTYKKGVKYPFSSEKELNEFLDAMMTENFKEKFYSVNEGNVILIRDGDVYLHEEGGGFRSKGLGASWLELNSIGFTDDNTVLIKFTSVGDKEEWGLEKDIRDEFTVKLVKGSDGKFRFDDGDYDNIALDLTFYNGMFYENGMLFN